MDGLQEFKEAMRNEGDAELTGGWRDRTGRSAAGSSSRRHMRKSDPIDLFMRWYNYDTPHVSLDRDIQEELVEAFAWRMPPEQTVTDGQSGEEHGAKLGDELIFTLQSDACVLQVNLAVDANPYHAGSLP